MVSWRQATKSITSRLVTYKGGSEDFDFSSSEVDNFKIVVKSKAANSNFEATVTEEKEASNFIFIVILLLFLCCCCCLCSGGITLGTIYFIFNYKKQK